MKILVRITLPLWLLSASIGGGLAHAQQGGHGYHPPMPDQQYRFRCRIDSDKSPVMVDVPVELASPGQSGKLDQSVALPAPLKPIRLTHYLASAVLEQTVIPEDGENGRPAIELSINGPKQSFQRWLIADDPERNRLVSFIATWRFMVADNKEQRDALYEQFRTELTRTPVVQVVSKDGADSWELEAVPGVSQRLGSASAKIRIKKFYPHFAIDNETGKPISLSDKRMNPAALVEFKVGKKKSERWVFSAFPEYNTGADEDVPYNVTLACKADKEGNAPDFVVVALGANGHEVWTRWEGKVTSRVVTDDLRVEINETRYTFHIAESLPSGRLVERYTSSETKGSVPALQIETGDASNGLSRMWLESGKPRILRTVLGPMSVAFGPGSSADETKRGHP
jgi:hypothetical protein